MNDCEVIQHCPLTFLPPSLGISAPLMVCCVTLPKHLHLSEPLRCLIIKREESFMVDRGGGQNFKFRVGQTKILPLPLPSSRSVTSSHTISLSEFQLPPLPSGSETPYLLRDGVRQGDNTLIIVCSRAGGPAGPSCVGEFQGGTPTGQTRRAGVLGGSGTQGGEFPLAQACPHPEC